MRIYVHSIAQYDRFCWQDAYYVLVAHCAGGVAEIICYRGTGKNGHWPGRVTTIPEDTEVRYIGSRLF
jgi:hypothetical protein